MVHESRLKVGELYYLFRRSPGVMGGVLVADPARLVSAGASVSFVYLSGSGLVPARNEELHEDKDELLAAIAAEKEKIRQEGIGEASVYDRT